MSKRVAKAKDNIRALVQQGYRLNPNATTSSVYRTAVATTGRGKERRVAAASVDAQARSSSGANRPMNPKRKGGGA